MNLHPLQFRKSPPLRTGYSLLEVLLALALSVVVFSAIAAGIQTHLTGLTRQKVMLERKQIARSILAMMANDLRAGIQYKAADYSGLENLIKTQQLMATSMLASMTAPATDPTASGSNATTGNSTTGTSAPTGTSPTNSQPTSTASPSSSTASSTTTATGEETESGVIDEEAVSFRPSLIGDSKILMLDISRLPRLDQYNPLTASPETLSQSPSDVKSLAYFFSDATNSNKEQIQFQNTAPGGLYRREIDRAVAAYAGDIELLDSPDMYTKLVASEVAEVSFRYFDGLDWHTSWDSAESEGFPVAIEINLVIDPARSSSNNTTYSYGGFDRSSMEGFRTVVHLPVSEPVEEE